MKTIEQNAYQEINTWMHRNARELELALWNFCFENGSVEAVAEALAYYQNEEGGFGNTVEPDCWNPESTPYSTMIAIGVLRKIGFFETAGIEHPMVQRGLNYLDSGMHSDENGWHFSVPSNDVYAHAPWWTFSEEMNKVQDMGITAALCSFILHYADRESDLFKKAVDYTKKILKKARELEDFGEMGAGGICGLLDDIMQCGLVWKKSMQGNLQLVKIGGWG